MFFLTLFINPSWNLHTPHSNQSSHIFHISVDRHSRHLYLESTSRSGPKNLFRATSRTVKRIPMSGWQKSFFLHIVNIIYMYIPRCVPCLFFSGWVVTTDLFLPGSSTWRKMRFTTLTSNKKMGWCTTPKFNLEPGNWFFSKFRSSPFPRCWFFRWSMYTLED